ncbi:MAG: enolase C-terminal domain-like protein [Halobacteriales archaeon]
MTSDGGVDRSPGAAPVDVAGVDAAVREIDLRIPFEYGVTTLRTVPHAVLRIELEDGTAGLSACNLAPKWFAKDETKTVADDLAALKAAVLAAGRGAEALDPAPSTFAFWRALADRQEAWAGDDHPALRWHMGVALVERAAIDAVCRRAGTTFGEAVRAGLLGIDLGALYDRLSGTTPADLLPAEPARSIRVRHTVGAADPLTPAEVEDPVDDDLPHALSECIERYGLTHFKLKVEGDPAEDADRLRAIAAVIEPRVDDPLVTLDANEGYGSIADLETLWESIRDDPALDAIESGLAAIEQPFPRAFALSDRVGEALDGWEGPPVIIDESDARVGDLSRALDLGYAGTSVKSCKGVCKSIANACLLARRREEGEPAVCTAEDLTMVGPVDLLQDLALVATLGIDHAERNGHHYFAGLDPLPEGFQKHARDRHSDLYGVGSDGVPRLDIRDGTVSIGSVLDAPYGVDGHPSLDGFEPLESWTPED